MRTFSRPRPSLIVTLAVNVAVLTLFGCSQPIVQETEIESALTAEELIETVTTEVAVYYPVSDTIVEQRITLDDDTDAIFAVLTKMFETKTLSSGGTVTLPRAEVLGVTVVDGLATIDFSAEVLGTGESDRVQQTALIALIHAVTQFPEVDRMAITVEGKTEGTIDGKDIATFWGEVTLADMPWEMTVGEQIQEGPQQ